MSAGSGSPISHEVLDLRGSVPKDWANAIVRTMRLRSKTESFSMRPASLRIKDREWLRD